MSMFFFFFNDTATTEIYTLSLHDALPIFPHEAAGRDHGDAGARKVGDGRCRGDALGRGIRHFRPIGSPVELVEEQVERALIARAPSVVGTTHTPGQVTVHLGRPQRFAPAYPP